MSKHNHSLPTTESRERGKTDKKRRSHKIYEKTTANIASSTSEKKTKLVHAAW